MDIYQHFRKEEHAFIDQVFSWVEQVERTFERKLTDFLDPREQQIVENIIGSDNDAVQFKFNGGKAGTERKRAIIAPYYEEISDDDFELVLLEATYHEKFISLAHPDVLGAFLSLGIKRKKLGEIAVGSGKLQIVVAEDICVYVQTNLTSIKHATVKLDTTSLTELRTVAGDWHESNHTVSSLRLDTVLSEIYNFSRKIASDQIGKQYVKVNFRTVDDCKFLLRADDLISMRGKGRSKLVRVNGQSKKEKWKITTALLK